MKSPVLLLLAFSAGVLAGPINVRLGEPNECAVRCTESSKFKYEPGTTYIFDYNVQTETSMEGASEDKAILGISATAHIEVLSKCDMALRLSDVVLLPASPQYIRSLEENTIRFSFQDGKIEDLCPLSEEQDWTMNIKKGVLSVFQNSMDNLEVDQTVHETDVTGECPAEYKLVNKGWYVKAIKKTKHLLGCMDRHGWRSSMQAAAYRVPSEVQSLPLMKSEHVCDQEIQNDGYLKSALCKETHVFRPFSHYNNGSMTKIIQKLTFRNKQKNIRTRQSAIERRASLLFTHSTGQQNMDRQQQKVQETLRQLCTITVKDIRPEVPMLFSQLIVQMRGLDASTLRSIYRETTRGNICSENVDKTTKFFQDAIPMVGTSSSVQILKELIMNKVVTGIEADMWLSSLALIQDPTLEMLAEVKALLDIRELGDEPMLYISALVNNYCTKHTNCAEDFEVTGIISTLQRNLGYGCVVRDENLEKVLMTLRALGNAGHSTTVGSAISYCFSRESNPIEVRVAALDAFRRLPCSTERSDAMDLLKDKDEDSELRIAAYLAVMKCPTTDIIDQVRVILAKEETNQVGSFIWSHLTNLMETSSPHKEALRSIVDDQRLKKEFDLEKIKFSRNYEGSFLFERINTGAMAESNVIWSSKSFIPRSAMLNLTVDLFGNSVNLLEVGARIEGFEYLMETYLGPYGYFGQQNSKKSIEKSRAKLDQLRGSMYMRIFGNEMMYKHFKGFDSIKSPNFNFLEFLIKISKKHDYSFSQSSMFLDSSMIIPTSSGLPLNLTVNGVSSIDLKASGTVDLRKVAARPRSLNIDGIIKPSGAVTISGSMSVDGLFSKSGMKMTTTLHTSTSLNGRIKLERGKVLEVELDTPQDKMEILDVKSAFFTIMGNEEKEQAMITENKKARSFCTGNKIAKIVGMELCGEIKYPNASMIDAAPYFPFTGPVNINLILHKRDTHIAYRLLAKRLETKEKSIAQLAFTTPGSQVKRSISVDYALDFNKKEMEMSSTSPWTNMVLKGNVVMEEKKKAFEGSFTKDGKMYGIRSVVDVENEQKMTKLSPKIEIIRPGMKDIVLAGTVDVDGTRRFETDLSLINAISHPISLRGTIIDTKKEKSVKASVQYDESGEYTLNAVLQSDFSPKKNFMRIVPKLIVKTPVEHLITVDGEVEHRQGKLIRGALNANVKDLLRKPISIKFSNVIISKKKNTKYDTDIKITSKWLTAKVDGTVNKGKNGQISSRVVVDYNINKISRNKLTLSGKFTNKTTTSLVKYTLDTNFINKNNPEYNFDTNLDLSHNNRHSEATVDVRYGKNVNQKKKTDDRIFLDATVNRKGGWKAATVDYKFIAEIPNKDINVILEGDHKHDRNDLINKMVLTSNKEEQAKTNLKLNYKNLKQINIGGDFTLVFPDNTININSDLIQKKKQYTHSLNMKINKKKSTMTTTYNQPGKGRHQIKSDVSLHFLKPITISGSTNLNMDKFRASTDVTYGKNKYGFETSKVSKDNFNHAIGVSAYYPDRAITADLETQMSGNTYGGKFTTNWDAKEKKTNSRVVIDGNAVFKSLAEMNGGMKIAYPGRTINLNGEHRHRGLQNINSHVDLSWNPREKIVMDLTHQTDSNNKISSDITITTPFKAMPKFSTEMSYENKPNNVETFAKVTWGQITVVSTDLTVRKPLSLIRSDIDVYVHTYSKKFRDIKAKLSHSFGDRVRATASGSIDSLNFNLDMSGQHTSMGETGNSVEGTITLTSDFDSLRTIVLRSSAVQNNDKFLANIYLDHNDKSYKYDLDMTHRSYLTNVEFSGKITALAPYYRGSYEWSAMMSDNDIKYTLDCDMGRGKKLYLDVSGNHVHRATRIMNGKVVLQSPWEPVRDIYIDLKHKHGLGLITHNTVVKSNRKIIGSGEVNYERKSNNVLFTAKATTPFSEDLSTSFDMATQTPYTSRMEIMWAPRDKITVESSLSGELPTLEGSLRVMTPFEQARNIILTASNKQEGDDWVSTGNIEYNIRKSINLETRLGMANRKIVRAVLTTPFSTIRRLETGMELTANGYDINGQADFQLEPIVGKFSTSVNADWSSDITGKARLETPYSDFPYTQVEILSKTNRKGRHSQVEIEYSPRQIISLDTLYSLQYPIIFDIELNTPFDHLQNVGGKIRHVMGKRGIQTHAEVTYAPSKTIESDLKLKWKNGIDCNVVVKTPFHGYEVSRSSLTHNGHATDFQTHGEVEVANKRMDIDVTLKHALDTHAEMIFHSPFNGFEELKASMNKRGELDDINVETSVTYGNNQEITVNANNKIATGILKTGLTFENPYTAPFKFDIDFNGMPTAFNVQVESSLGTENKFEHQTRCIIRLPHIDITNNFEYLIADEGRKFGAKLNTEGDQWTDIKYTAEASCNEHRGSVSGYWKMMDKIMGSLMITAPALMEDDVTVAFSHEGTLDRFNTAGSLRFLDQAYSGKMNHYQDGIKQIRTSGELTTPFQGYEDMKYDYNHELTGSSLVGHAKASYGYNKEIVAEIDVALDPNMSGTLTVNTPFQHYRENKLVFSKKGKLTDMVIETSFENNRKPVFKYTVTHVYLPRRMESSISLQGIFMEDVSASFKHVGEPMVDCHTEIKSSCGKLMSAFYTSVIKKTRNGMTVNLNGEYDYYGQGQKASVNMVRDGELDDGTVRATASLNGQEISAQSTYRFGPNKADIDATANTPFKGFRDLSVNVHYTLTGSKLESNTALQYMDGQRISVKGYFLQNDWKFVDSNVEVSTPFGGFENNKIVFTGNMDGSTLDVYTSLENHRLQKISSILKVKSADENSLDWTLATPFEGFEDVSLSTTMKKSINTPNIDMKFRYGQKDYQIRGDLNRQMSPITGQINLITPIENFERTDLSFSHSGSLDNFKTSATFDSRLTGRMDGEASLTYISPLNMDINAELRSRVPYMEDLALKMKTTENRKDKAGYVMAKWSNRDKVELEGSYKEKSRWSTEQRIGEIKLSTPFEALKTTSVYLDCSINGDKYSEKLSATLNDKSIVDMDVDVTIADVPEISVSMDKPYPVEVTVSGQNGHTIGGEIFVNWNTKVREQNVRLQSSFTPNGGRFDVDKEFNIKLIHPVRTMGINGFIQTSGKHVKSNGAIIWNEHKGQKFAYDLDLSDSTRRNRLTMDGSLKLVFPGRSLAFQGALKNVKNMKSVDGYIMWDADRDAEKKIGMKAVLAPGSRTNKFDVTLSIPTIQRDIKIDSEITVDSGRVMFDGKTEFSYSTDSSKTLVLTSNVKDVSYDREHKNYTMSLGIRHSYTDTDVQLTSHIGHSTDRYSTGMELQYLTASRRRMNMVVLGEIDQLRRQINIEVLNPMKKMRILGEVESVTPFKASIKNEIDDRPGVSAAVAFDEKSFDFQTHYDINDLAKSFHVEGEYVNSTAVKADAYSMINGERITDSVMTARLNTSRILHTRINWRPTLLSDLEAFSAGQVETFMAASEAMSQEVKAEIGREIQYKYNRIMTAVKEEIKPYVELSRSELIQFEDQLKHIIQEMRRMHGRNDLYIRDMGDKIDEYYLRTHMGLRELVGQYRESYNQMFNLISSHMEQIKSYPITQKYYELIYKGERMTEELLEDITEWLIECTKTMKAYIDGQSIALRQNVNLAKERIANHPYVQLLKEKMRDLKNIDYAEHVKTYSQNLGKKMESLNISGRYNDAVNNIHSLVNHHIDELMKREDVKYMHSIANEAYQEGKWAVQYWGVEENVRKQMHELYSMLKQLIRSEIEAYKHQYFTILPKYNVTYYNPSQAELQADIYLPLPITALDRVPDDVISAYVDDAKKMVNDYLPTKDSVMKLYYDYFPQTITNETEVDQEFKEYMKIPTKRRLRSRRLRHRKQ